MPHLTQRTVRSTVSGSVGGPSVDGSFSPVYIQRVPIVVVNGERRALPPGVTLAELLQTLALSPEHVAVERNREIVPKAAYGATDLAEGDSLEIVTFVGGG